MSIEVSCDVTGVREFQAAMQKLDSGLQNRVYRCLVSWAADVKAEAQRLVLVKTGYLRSKIYAIVHDWVVNVGADATYGYFIEMGTRYMQAHPYLYPAIQQYLPELQSLIVAAIEQAKAEAGF